MCGASRPGARSRQSNGSIAVEHAETCPSSRQSLLEADSVPDSGTGESPSSGSSERFTIRTPPLPEVSRRCGRPETCWLPLAGALRCFGSTARTSALMPTASRWRCAPRATGSAAAFDLFVIEDGVYRERFPNVSLNSSSPRYVERIVNDPKTGSVLVRVVDLLVVPTVVLTLQFATLAGGDDGLVGLDDADFVGSEAAGNGLHAFDPGQDIALLTVPQGARGASSDASLLRGGSQGWCSRSWT